MNLPRIALGIGFGPRKPVAESSLPKDGQREQAVKEGGKDESKGKKALDKKPVREQPGASGGGQPAVKHKTIGGKTLPKKPVRVMGKPGTP